MGTLLVQGTSTTANVIRILPEIDAKGLNVKIVATVCRELFDAQLEAVQRRVLSPSEWIDSTVISNRSRVLSYPWLAHKVAEEYAITSDWDDRWRTGGTVDEVCEEAHISPGWILEGIERFARERETRLQRMAGPLGQALTE